MANSAATLDIRDFHVFYSIKAKRGTAIFPPYGQHLHQGFDRFCRAHLKGQRKSHLPYVKFSAPNIYNVQPVAGEGLLALTQFLTYEPIRELDGTIVTTAQKAADFQSRTANENSEAPYYIDISDQLSFCLGENDLGSFVNHACGAKANAGFFIVLPVNSGDLNAAIVLLCAIKRIRPNTEILADFQFPLLGMDLNGPCGAFDCHCNDPKCGAYACTNQSF